MSNPIDLLLIAWVSGLVSALEQSRWLEDYAKHIDMSTLDDAQGARLVPAFCTDGQPETRSRSPPSTT